MNRISRLGRDLAGRGGFSLLEIMIVITILGILAVMVVPRFMDLPKKARVAAAKQQIADIGMALEMYSSDNGNYPTTEQGLEALINKPSSEPSPQNYNEGGYLKKREVPKDPWGRAFLYRSPGEQSKDYELVSLGADGKDGGEGENADIRSWE
ncbi:MAG: type II secretion system protein GspG [Spirochaetes bacterium]|nr:MAG: type II secretion system protein GspG [Spirochaetota bacterium]